MAAPWQVNRARKDEEKEIVFERRNSPERKELENEVNSDDCEDDVQWGPITTRSKMPGPKCLWSER